MRLGVLALALSCVALGARAQPVLQAITLPALGTVVPVPAGQATPIWTFNGFAKTLSITIPVPPCLMTTADNSAAWELVGGGFSFSIWGPPVPNKSLVLTCTSAQTTSLFAGVGIAEGH